MFYYFHDNKYLFNIHNICLICFYNNGIKNYISDGRWKCSLIIFTDGNHTFVGNPLSILYYIIYSKKVNTFCQFYTFLILSIASIVFSLLPNAVNLKYPSPAGPNPTPGVPTTFAFSSK